MQPTTTPPRLPSSQIITAKGPNWRLLKIALGIGMVVIVLLFAAIWWGGPAILVRIAEQSAKRKVDPKTIELCRWLETEPIDLTEEISDVAPLPDDLIEKSRMLWRHWRKVEYEPSIKKLESLSLSAVASEDPGFEASIPEDCKALLPFYFDLLHDPQFQIEALIFGETVSSDGGFPFIQKDFFETIRKLTLLRIASLAREGNPGEAVGMATDLICAAKVHLYSPLIAQLQAAMLCEDGIHGLVGAMGFCTDSKILRAAMERISGSQIAAKGFIQNEIPVGVSDFFGSWVTASYGGVELKLEGGTGFALMAEGWVAQARYLEMIGLPASNRDPILQGLITKQIQSCNETAAILDPDGKAPNATSRLKNRYFHALFRISLASATDFSLSARQRETTALQRFDLLRIRLAQRIHFLETGSEAVDWDTVSPAYFETPMLDRFQATEIQLPVAPNGMFYSFGLDGDDDGGRELYDPTNGSVSGGDLFLLPRQ